MGTRGYICILIVPVKLVRKIIRDISVADTLVTHLIIHSFIREWKKQGT